MPNSGGGNPSTLVGDVVSDMIVVADIVVVAVVAVVAGVVVV